MIFNFSLHPVAVAIMANASHQMLAAVRLLRVLYELTNVVLMAIATPKAVVAAKRVSFASSISAWNQTR